MKIYKFLPLTMTLIFLGCSPIGIQKPTSTSIGITSVLSSFTPSPSITKPVSTVTETTTFTITPIPTATPIPTYQVIDTYNINRLSLLHQWEVENIFQKNSTDFWFLDSSQFIIPIWNAAGAGVQYLDINNFSQTWFVPTGSSQAVTAFNDQMMTFLHGLHIFDRHGVEIKTITANDNCNEGIAYYIVTIPKTSMIVTGHWRIGDITNSYGKSRMLIWDTNKDTCQDLIGEFVGEIWSLSVSPDGRYISYSVLTSTPNLDAESTVYIYDLQLHKMVCSLVGLFVQYNSQNQLCGVS